MKWLLTFLLDYLIEKLLPRLKAWVESVVEKFKREKDQEEKSKVIDQNIETKAKRDEKTRKDEQDFLNS